MDSKPWKPAPSSTAVEVRPGPSMRSRWIKNWLSCLAFFYPALWLSVFAVLALPGLLGSVLWGDRLAFVRLGAFGMLARSVPARLIVEPYRADSLATSSPWMLILLLAVIAAALVAAGRRNRLLSGLAITMLADAAFMFPLTRFGHSRQAGTVLILTSIFFLALLCLGLRRMLRGWRAQSYWLRVGSLQAGFVLPLGIVWVVMRLSHDFHFWPHLPALMAPPAFAAFLVGLRMSGEPAADSRPASWRQPFWGLVASVFLVLGVHWGGPPLARAFELRQLDANRAAMAKLPPIPVNAPYLKVFFQKGVTLSAEFPNPYASAGARQMLRLLPRYGVNAVAIIPYGWMELGLPEVHGFGHHSWESEAGMLDLSRLAHALGIKVMLKPGIWVRGGHFAGDVVFHSPAVRAEWFKNYSRFIVRYARFAARIHADVFCVGGEFIHLTPYAAQWRRIIARVRKVYPGPLTYGANFGSEFEQLRFWDALDYIGLQEYYPLPRNLSTAALLQKVTAVQKRFHKPVIFTEAGFPSIAGANLYPWKDGARGKVDLSLQARCYEAIFRAFYNQPWFKGMYWWKIGTNGYGGPRDTSLTPWDKPAMSVIKQWYLNGGPSKPDGSGAGVHASR